MKADNKLPVAVGTAVNLSCKAGFQLTGDKTVTCDKTFTLKFSTEPQCGELLMREVFNFIISQLCSNNNNDDDDDNDNDNNNNNNNNNDNNNDNNKNQNKNQKQKQPIFTII
jgi:hypothetical protein